MSLRRVAALLVAAVAATVLIHAATCTAACATMPPAECVSPHAVAAVDHLPDAVEAVLPFTLLILLLGVAVISLAALGAGTARPSAVMPGECGRPPPRSSPSTSRRLARLSLLLC